MPYFVFEVVTVGSIGRKSANCIAQYDSYKDAKSFARQKRIDLNVTDPSGVRIMFADDEGEAKDKIEENREAPILREWEK